MRCFISIDLPQEIQHEVKQIQKKLPAFKGKLTEFENLHLTLKFLGEGITEEQIQEIGKRLREIRREGFEVEIDDVGIFKPEFIRIIWLHLASDELLNLQREVDDRLQDLFKAEERFMSHVTIGRVKYVKNRGEFLEELKKIRIKNLKFKVDKFFLKKSELTSAGPNYKVLQEFDLV